MDDEGLVLNLVSQDTGGALPPSRSQQRKLKWSEQRALKASKRPVVPGSASPHANCLRAAFWLVEKKQ